MMRNRPSGDRSPRPAVMRRAIIRSLLLFLFIFLSLSLAVGCNGRQGDPTSITITPATATIAINQTKQLTAVATDADGIQINNATLTWNSATPGVATVNNAGLVTGVSVGTTIMTASSNGVTSNQSTITVSSGSPLISGLALGSITSITTTTPVITDGQLALDGAGNLFIADTNNHLVRRVDATTGTTTVAGTIQGFFGENVIATTSKLDTPRGIAVDGAGNLFIADTFNQRIRKVDAIIQFITTVAGTAAPGFSGDGGPATSAALNTPRGIAVDGAGNLFIADTNNNRIRRVDAGADGQVTGTPSGAPDEDITTVAGTITAGFSGDGFPATSAELNTPNGVAVDGAGNLFIADTNNNRIRRVDAAGIIDTIAGTGSFFSSGDDGPAISAELSPAGVAVDVAGNIFFVDLAGSRIRAVRLAP
ncbi:MAG: Ig-like domain-containing protein [Nitrospiria bacterium]